VTLPEGPGTTPPGWLVEVPLAHRGLHDDARPENSLAAFEAAATVGYGVELDVHLSSDGHPVIIHDAKLSRVAGIDRAVGGLTADELGRVRLLGSEQGIPRLTEALEVLRDVPVMVEIKSNRLRAGALEPAIAEVLDGHAGPTCVASFNPVVLRWFRRNRPDMVRVLTATAENLNGFAAPLLRRFADLRDLPSVAPAAVSYDVLGLPRPAVDAWRADGGAVVTWTVDDEATLEVARNHADNIIFEHIRPDPHGTAEFTPTNGDRA
jgi:glycerophosphoryl diester phosphodiesterase